MNKLTTMLLGSILFSGCTQRRNGTIEENKKMNFKAIAYVKKSIFVFSVFTTDSAGNALTNDTLGLFTTDQKAPIDDAQERYIMQWQSLRKLGGKYYFVKENYTDYTTGLEVDDSFLFLHPPRENGYRILQFCPYPYFFNENKIGSVWTWDLEIGSHWSIDSIYNIPDGKNILFKTTYTLTDTGSINTPLGSMFCHIINACSVSAYGISKATYCLNYKYGLVNFKLTTTNSMLYRFNLIEVLPNADAALSNPLFDFHLSNSRKQEIDRVFKVNHTL